MNTAVEALTRAHVPVHVHANNYGTYSVIGGVPLPDILEVTLVRADSYELVAPASPGASAVDSPNDPKRPEFVLDAFS